MSFFFNHHHALQTQNNFNGYLTAWHIIQWMQNHGHYTNAAVSVAEYAAKTALFRYLPHNTAERYTHYLSMMGLDVESVNAPMLAEYALEMAVPALADYYGTSSRHTAADADDQPNQKPAAFLAGDAATHIITHIISQIRDIAGMSPSNDEGHRKMAKCIQEAKQPGSGITASDFKKAAFNAYGNGAHWLALALPQLEHDGKLLINSEIEALENELRISYTYWVNWAKKVEPDLNHMQADSAIFLKHLEEGCVGYFNNCCGCYHNDAATTTTNHGQTLATTATTSDALSSSLVHDATTIKKKIDSSKGLYAANHQPQR